MNGVNMNGSSEREQWLIMVNNKCCLVFHKTGLEKVITTVCSDNMCIVVVGALVENNDK